MADVTVTPANVKLSSTNPTLRKFALSGAAVIAGQSIAKNSSGKAVPFDADAASPVNVLVGVALCSAPGTDQPIWYSDRDSDFDGGFTATQGETYVGSDTPGGICPVGDLDPGDAVNYVGTGKSTGKIDLNVDATGIAKP